MQKIKHRTANLQITPKSILKMKREPEIECSHQLIRQDGFNVCRNCGLTKGRIVANLPPRAYTEEEKKVRRKTEPVRVPGARTYMNSHRDATGRRLSIETLEHFRYLSKIHITMGKSFERNIRRAQTILNALAENLGLTTVVKQDALRIYSASVHEKLSLGRSMEVLMAASVYTSLRYHSMPRTLEELFTETEESLELIAKTYRLIVVHIAPKLGLKIPTIGARAYLTRFCQKLDLSIALQKRCFEILETIESAPRLRGKDPKGIAAGIIYFVAKKSKYISQKVLAKATYVTDVTIRARVYEIQDLTA